MQIGCSFEATDMGFSRYRFLSALIQLGLPAPFPVRHNMTTTILWSARPDIEVVTQVMGRPWLGRETMGITISGHPEWMGMMFSLNLHSKASFIGISWNFMEFPVLKASSAPRSQPACGQTCQPHRLLERSPRVGSQHIWSSCCCSSGGSASRRCLPGRGRARWTWRLPAVSRTCLKRLQILLWHGVIVVPCCAWIPQSR